MSNLIERVDEKHAEYKGRIYYLRGKYFVRNKKKGGRWTTEYLHREVYQDFFGDMPPGFVVHHKDENKQNNSPDNLALLTAEEHMSRHTSGRKLSEAHKQKITGRPKGSRNSVVHHCHGTVFPPSF